MKKYRIVFMAFLCCLISCQRNHSPRIIDLPYHKNINGGGTSYLVENYEKLDTMQLFQFFIIFYKKQKLNSYKDNSTQITTVNFYQKNSTTSYFIHHADDPGGFSSKVLSDYRFGWDEMPRYGLAQIVAQPYIAHSKKWIFQICFYNYSKNKWVYDTLRDESKRGWYQQHRGNELVRLFNQGEPFPLDSIQTDTLKSKKRMLNNPKARSKVRKRRTKN